MGGKEKIRITEIWVIITQHITKGAQEKIYEKYKLRKIKFIDGSRLEKLIDEYIPTFWIDLTLDVGDYLTSIRAKNKEIERTTSLVPFLDFYIEPDISEIVGFDYSLKALKKRTNKIDIYERIDEKKIILIEGEMGSGKSKLLRHLLDYYSEPETYVQKKVIPIFTTYKNLLDKYNGTISELIKDTLGEKTVKNLKDINYLLLIDAVDEKDISPNEQIEELSQLIQNIKSLEEVKAIITSRYLKEFNITLNAIEGILRCEIRPLSFKKTMQFLNTICAKLNITSRIFEDLKKSQLFKELPRTPISAIILAKLLQDNTRDLPSNMTELYSKYIELILGRWDVEKGLQSQKEYQALDNIMMQLAEYMIKNEMPCIAIEEAKELFRNYLKARNLDIIPERLFETMLKRCEIIMTDIELRTLSFKHRTFAEFLFAKLLTDGKTLEINERAFEPYWMNTFFFYTGILKDCPDLLTTLINTKPEFEPKKWFKIANMANYFLAAYTTPYEVITNGLMSIMIEAATLYRDIVEGEIESLFSRWPRMHILWLIQILIRHGYSYEFLNKAMEEAALKIDESKIEEDLKAYSIFFLNVAYIDATSEQSFDFLLKDHLGKLPLDIELAIRHESEKLTKKSLLLKKQEKHFKKILKNNQPLSSQIKKMYEKPVKMLPEPKK